MSRQEKLPASEEGQQRLFDLVPDAIVVSDSKGRIVRMNSRAETLFGYSREELLGQPIDLLLPARLRALHAGQRAGYIAAPRTRPMTLGRDLHARRKDGSEVPVDIGLSHYIQDGAVLVIAVIRDVTEHKRMEQDLKESEEKYWELFKNETDAVLIIDAETGRLEDVNQAALALFGYSKEEFLGLKVADISGEKAKTRSTIEQLAKVDPNLERIAERLLLKKDGTVFSGEISPGVFFSRGRKKIIGAIRDITERRENAAKLQQYVEQLRTFTHRIVKAKEDEATRIARELHDEASQLLAGVHIGLGRLLRAVPKKNRDSIQEITQHLTRVEDQLRSIAHDLRPAVLDKLGLLPALETLANQITDRFGLRVSVEASIGARLPPDVENAIYRIVQESLNNVTKHARASSVLIRIEEETGAVRCSIKDNGVGFDAAGVLSSSRSSGLGLLGIRERLQEFAGALQVNSAPGQGTELIATIPLNRQPTGPT